NRTYLWDSLYTRIRATNITLKNLATPQFENSNNIVERLKGEAHFLRAYYYQQLLRFYGGIPLVDRAYELNETDYTVPRGSYEECVNFIVADCDTAINLLKGLGISTGRASDVAAMALKARVLLYAASDLHDMPT